MYKIKIKAFECARDRVLSEHQEVQSISEYIEKEMQENGFHEKSELREKMNRYMSEYIQQNTGSDIQARYEQFYWTTAQDIFQEFVSTGQTANPSIAGYEEFMHSQVEYEEMLKKGGLTIYEEPTFDQSKYYNANTQNSVELDTYITSPGSRSIGTARIIVFEGIKKHMQRQFADVQNGEIYLCSTLHRDNLPSKYVSEFFGLKDSLFVNRRQGRDREVHICRVLSEEADAYLSGIQDRLAVLYGYNPEQRQIPDEIKRKILEEQLKYEREELSRLNRAKTVGTLKGINLRFVKSKSAKVKMLKKELSKIAKKKKVITVAPEDHGDEEGR